MEKNKKTTNIKLDLSKANIKILEKDYLKAFHCNDLILQAKGPGNEFLGWHDLPVKIDETELKKIKAVVEFLLKNKIKYLVVIGIGGSYLGSQAALDFVQGFFPGKKRKIQILFAGNSISSLDLKQKLALLKNKKFAINVISKSGTTTEPAIAFRFFEDLLWKQNPTMAADLIFATTDAKKGTLFDLATKKGYQKFVIPDSVGGRYSVLTSVGLLPICAAGIDIDEFIAGFVNGYHNFLPSSQKNLAINYAIARQKLYEQYPCEMLVSYEINYQFLAEWWKQLFAESEGKQEKGLLPISANFSRDLHSLGQFIQQGSKVLFETVIWTEKVPSLKIPEQKKNWDKLSYLEKQELHGVNKAAFMGTLKAHCEEGKVPQIVINIKNNSAKTLGELFYFFEKSCAISGYLLKINPFDQPGVEIYKQNMFKLLKK